MNSIIGTIEWNTLTTEYLPIAVNLTVDGVVHNPTGDSVQIAVPLRNSLPTQWFDGVWDIDDSSGTPVYIAQILVGPAGVVQVVGDTWYDVWVKVSDNPEIPARVAARLHVLY